MSPTIMINDKIITNSDSNISRGDLVVFYYPNDPTKVFVKRCVAIPDDELFVLNKDLFIHHHEGDEWIKENFKDYTKVVFAGKIWVKNPYMKKHPGIHHDENIINTGDERIMPIFNFAPIRVDKNNYFMMGDNRDHSNDSRFWGAVPYDNIEGTPWFIYFSIDENWEIRWDRVGKTPTDLESPQHLDLAKQERLKESKVDHGIY
jgi:signal peptidase I